MSTFHLYLWYIANRVLLFLFDKIVINPPGQLLQRELEVVASGGVEEDATALVNRPEPEHVVLFWLRYCGVGVC